MYEAGRPRNGSFITRNALALPLLAAGLIGSGCQGGALDTWQPEAGIPVYYVGDAGQAAAISGELGVDVIPAEPGEVAGAPYILMVEGSPATDRAWLGAELESGNPVIVLGDTQVAAEAHEVARPDKVMGKGLPDERPDLGTAHGFVRLPDDTSRSFSTSEQSAQEAAKMAHAWANEALQDGLSRDGKETEELQYKSDATAVWNAIHIRDYSTGTNYHPYGKLNIRSKFYKLDNDDQTDYDWYMVEFELQSVPGEQLGWWGDFHCRQAETVSMRIRLHADYVTDSYELIEYSPTTTVGQSTTSVQVGVTAGFKAATATVARRWSYSTPDVVTYDESDYDQELAEWYFGLTEETPAAENTYKVMPGAVIRVNEGDDPRWDEYYEIVWRAYTCVKFGGQIAEDETGIKYASGITYI